MDDGAKPYLWLQPRQTILLSLASVCFSRIRRTLVWRRLFGTRRDETANEKLHHNLGSFDQGLAVKHAAEQSKPRHPPENNRLRGG